LGDFVALVFGIEPPSEIAGIAHRPLDCRMSNHSRFASDEIEKLFAKNGLRDLGDAFRVGEYLTDQHYRLATRHKHRHVVKFDLAGPDGTISVYIKRQWRRERWLPRPTDIRHRIHLQCSPVHEWRGLRMLEEIGVNVAQPMAVFWSGWGLARGAVVTRAVPTNLSMADLLLSGKLLEMPTDRLNALIDAAVNVIIRMHQARISWRSMKAKHFYPEELRDGAWRIWLIDCEGVYRWASRRDCDREWKTFVETFTSHTSVLRKPFLAAYHRALGGQSGLKKSA
jgi:hypothetical protein